MNHPNYADLVCPACGSDNWKKREITCISHGNKVRCDCGWTDVDQTWNGKGNCLVERKEAKG